MKKTDMVIIAAVLLVAAVLFLFQGNRTSGEMVVLYADQTELGRYPLSEDRIIPVDLPEGYNIVVISDRCVSVREADCHNQVCVNTPAVSHMGETIVCLPHRFYVKIE
ncbi:MAG: NusG domain II-containing protein [Lachnospiraceae bacterium]|nr:NusG domain II-containing protein [Lachnospiraceae bacterium]